MFAAARVTTETLGIPCRPKYSSVETSTFVAPWKRRLTSKLLSMRRDLSRLLALQRNHLQRHDLIEILYKKYLSNGASLSVAIEILRQKILACSRKIKRYTTRMEGFRQNKLFLCNQKNFYASLSGGNKQQKMDSDFANADEVIEFWRNLWGNKESHNVNATWINDVTETLTDMVPQRDIVVTEKMVGKAVKKLRNWKAVGPDGVHNFWIKHLTSLHSRLASQIQAVLSGEAPEWLTLGRTVLIKKNKDLSDAVVSNYRPITCLSNTWKLITSIVSKEIIAHLEKNKVWPWEQKGCKFGSRGTKDHLLVDKLVTFLTKRKHRNLRMTWIDYRKAYDSVPHSWILKVLDMYKVGENIRNFLRNSMKLWKTEVTLNGFPLGCVNIRKGIYQGDSLSPLLFVLCLFPLSVLLRHLNKGFNVDGMVVSHLLYLDDLKLYSKSEEDMLALVNTVRIFSDDIRMNFSFEKCATITCKRGNVVDSNGIQLPQGMIEGLSMSASYKYLGILEAAGFQHEVVKSNVTATYKRRLRLILQSRLSGHNQILAINGFAVPVIRYTAGVVNWTISEAAELDRLTRKQMTLFKALHPRSDIDRLYIPRRDGGRGLLSIANVIDIEKSALSTYVHQSQIPILNKVYEYLMSKVDATSKPDTISTHLEQWKSKALHGQWPQLLTERSPDSSLWLRRAHLKPVTEALICAAQDQAICTNWLGCHILGTVSSDLCRRCRQFPESIEHIVAGCPVLAQTIYLERHNAVASAVHWCLCGHCGFPRSDNWWMHQPEPVSENSHYRLLYDFNIFTDKWISARRPDLVFLDKEVKCAYLIDIACVMDRNVVSKETEKIDKYLNLRIELQTLWNTRVVVVPLVFGALGSLSNNISDYFRQLKLCGVSVHQLQKTVLLRTATIVRQHLSL